MRLLIATSRTNGTHDNDYDFCIEGELVHIQQPCAGDLRNPDGPCGCGRGFAGMNSHRATTTALVVEHPMDARDLRDALRASLVAGGWIDEGHREELDQPMITDALAAIAEIAEHFEVGTVVRRRLNWFTGTDPDAAAPR